MKVVSYITSAVAALCTSVAQAHPNNAISEGASSFLAQFHAHPHGIGLLAIAALIVIGTALFGIQSIKHHTARSQR